MTEPYESESAPVRQRSVPFFLAGGNRSEKRWRRRGAKKMHFTVTQVQRVRMLRASGMRQVDVATQLSVPRSRIADIDAGRTWKSECS
jgi:hypothetical protein